METPTQTKAKRKKQKTDYLFKCCGRLIWQTDSKCIKAPSVKSKINLTGNLYEVTEIYHAFSFYTVPGTSKKAWKQVITVFLKHLKYAGNDFAPHEDWQVCP